MTKTSGRFIGMYSIDGSPLYNRYGDELLSGACAYLANGSGLYWWNDGVRTITHSGVNWNAHINNFNISGGIILAQVSGIYKTNVIQVVGPAPVELPIDWHNYQTATTSGGIITFVSGASHRHWNNSGNLLILINQVM
jgi:hypothetical protein